MAPPRVIGWSAACHQPAAFRSRGHAPLRSTHHLFVVCLTLSAQGRSANSWSAPRMVLMAQAAPPAVLTPLPAAAPAPLPGTCLRRAPRRRSACGPRGGAASHLRSGGQRSRRRLHWHRCVAAAEHRLRCGWCQNAAHACWSASQRHQCSGTCQAAAPSAVLPGPSAVPPGPWRPPPADDVCAHRLFGERSGGWQPGHHHMPQVRRAVLRCTPCLRAQVADWLQNMPGLPCAS